MNKLTNILVCLHTAENANKALHLLFLFKTKRYNKILEALDKL